MPLEVLNLNGTWKLKDIEYGSDHSTLMGSAEQREWLETHVPGDIHESLIKAGRIPDPFIDTNSTECNWTGERDWWHEREFDVPATFAQKPLILVLDGIDTYATIFVNDTEVGRTDNAFLSYQFDVTKYIRPGQTNKIAIRIHAIRQTLDSQDTSKYFACFYRPRVFARKAQCQFSWDWAPDLPAAGIWQGVRLEARSVGIITDVAVRTKINGSVLFHIKVDDQTRDQAQQDQSFVLRVTIDDDGQKHQHEVAVRGNKNFINLHIPDPKLWWPKGYGQPHLYNYTVELLDAQGICVHQRQGHLGLREVKLIEDDNGDNTQSFRFQINGKDVFCMGANWVPADCFPGTATRDRYDHLLQMVRDANMNMIRIWGGGVYEKDVFYDLCDEYGIMIWQDLMFACSDIPDDDLHWTNKLIPEFEYQVRRLRNHPCIVHWCGGNEKTGTFGKMKSYGETVTNYLGRGVVNHLVPDLAYTPSSPYSMTDVGNEPESGDTHGGIWETAFRDDIRLFRQYIDKKRTSFMSEFGLHGPPELRSIKRFISEGKLWPLNGVWEHHIMDNPYSSLEETFVEVQKASAAALFHAPESAADFVKVAGTFQSEVLYEEYLHHRRRQMTNSGALLWMLNDCWPAASWALIDYYGIPKQVFYAIKRACQPCVLSFRQTEESCEVYLTHQLNGAVSGQVSIDIATVDGKTQNLAPATDFSVGAHGSALIASVAADKIPALAHSYLVARAQTPDGQYLMPFFHCLWKDIAWPDPELTVDISPVSKAGDTYRATMTVAAKKYARCVNAIGPTSNTLFFSDNYFDILPGQSHRIEITSSTPFEPSDLAVRHWLDTWD